MLRSVLGAGLLDDLHIDIHNMDVVSDAPYELDDYNLIFDSGKESADSDASSLRRRLTLNLGGSTWQLNVSTLPSFIHYSQNWRPSLVAFAGVALSMMVFFFMRVLGLSRDASDARARQVELSLHAKEKQLAGLTASIDEVLWRFSLPDGKLVYVSQAVERM
jgi:hypothetical protein